MCGIAGFADGNIRSTWSRGSSTADGEAFRLREMCEAIRHRGPDDEGMPRRTRRRRSACGGCSIIDLATGHQPIHNEDSTVWVVFNGEIYNYRELRARARSSRATASTRPATPRRSSTPTRSGARTRSRGCAACSASRCGISRSATLLLARDRAGIKPLHYAEHGGRLYFGSEIKSLLAAGASSARHRSRGARSLPVVPLHAARRDRSSRASASCRPGTCCAGRTAGVDGQALLGGSGTTNRSAAPTPKPSQALRDGAAPTPCDRT